MKKKLLLIFMGAIVSFAFSVNTSYAFCVYNKTDKIIYVDESSGGRNSSVSFASGVLQPGEKKCCNWKNKDCNVKGKRDSLVGFDVEYVDGTPAPSPFRPKTYSICKNFKIKAGGALVVSGKNKNYRCIRYDY